MSDKLHSSPGVSTTAHVTADCLHVTFVLFVQCPATSLW